MVKKCCSLQKGKTLLHLNGHLKSELTETEQSGVTFIRNWCHTVIPLK